MNCQEVQSLLLEAEAIHAASDGAVARDDEDAAIAQHLSQCAACGELARKLRRLEQTVRSLPAPLGSEEARVRFEQRLHEMQTAVKPAGRILRLARSPWPAAAAAVAAAIVLAIGGGLWAYHAHQHKVVASTQTIDDLVEWNLRLAQATPDERHKLYADSADGVKQSVGQAPLTEADRKSADELMQTGALLADTQDPLAEADHFSQMADLLVTQMDGPARASPQAMDRLGQTYFLVVDKGIRRNLERAEAAAGFDSPERQKRVDKIIQHSLQLQARLEAFLEKHPAAARPQLRKALELHKRHIKARKWQQQQQNVQPPP